MLMCMVTANMLTCNTDVCDGDVACFNTCITQAESGKRKTE